MSGSTTTIDWASARSLPGVGGERGPVTVFDREMQNAVVMAPASQFMAASSMVWEGGRRQNRYLGFGLYGRMKEVQHARKRNDADVSILLLPLL